MKKIELTFQHFHGCPNGPKFLAIINEAIIGLEENIILTEQVVDSQELAEKYSFRGSPTLLINDVDIDDMQIPESPQLSCRFYPGGLPSKDKIRNRLMELLRSDA